tara:strand:+ start:3258 stop:3491 length:234 start_codon:yes stop_codon:yes gene_type:complete
MLFLNADGVKILSSFDIIKVDVLIGILFITHWLMKNTSVKEVSKKMSPISLGIVWSIMIVLLVIAQGSSEQFIYFQI